MMSEKHQRPRYAHAVINKHTDELAWDHDNRDWWAIHFEDASASRYSLKHQRDFRRDCVDNDLGIRQLRYVLFELSEVPARSKNEDGKRYLWCIVDKRTKGYGYVEGGVVILSTSEPSRKGVKRMRRDASKGNSYSRRNQRFVKFELKELTND